MSSSDLDKMLFPGKRRFTVEAEGGGFTIHRHIHPLHYLPRSDIPVVIVHQMLDTVPVEIRVHRGDQALRIGIVPVMLQPADMGIGTPGSHDQGGITEDRKS